MSYISICIPVYKNIPFLQRLLDSVAVQTFQDFDIIITDDTPDDSVKELMGKYSNLPIQYFKNTPALGTPANWNAAIKQATGEWIKIMHHDDWFATPDALQTFATATKEGKKFIFSGYNNIDASGTILKKAKLTATIKKLLVANPVILLSENFIGQPSVCMVHRSVKAAYDERMKWRVDIDFYMQLLKHEKSFYHIPNVLINLGISESQVTHSCLNVPGVELPEGLLLIEKYGVHPLKNLLVYDAWWRIIRNANTRRKDMLFQYGSNWPKAIVNMVDKQQNISPHMLKKGILSKCYMLLSYVENRRYLTDNNK